MSKMLEMMMIRKQMIEHFKDYLKKILKACNFELKNSEIYLFGSALKGNQVAASDIDILIIAEVPKNHLKRAEIISGIEENAGLPWNHPFEIHLINREEFEIWKDIYNFDYENLASFLSK